MNLLMSATPLAMDLCCGHPFSHATFVLQWHVIGMFAPSFFTGGLIKRAGVLNVLLAGAALLFICVGVAMHGTSLMHFWWALTLLGIGWNFLYIGGTTLLTEAHDPAEKAKIQGVNDFLIYVVMVCSSLTSGVVVTGSGGWALLTELTVPFLAVTALATSILWLKQRRTSTAPTPLLMSWVRTLVSRRRAGAGALPAGPWLLRIAEATAHRSRGPIECRNGSRFSVSRGESPLPPPGALPAHSAQDARGRWPGAACRRSSRRGPRAPAWRCRRRTIRASPRAASARAPRAGASSPPYSA